MTPQLDAALRGLRAANERLLAARYAGVRRSQLLDLEAAAALAQTQVELYQRLELEARGGYQPVAAEDRHMLARHSPAA